MRCIKVTVIIAIVLTVLPAILLYTPPPDGIEQHLPFAVFMFFIKLHYVGNYLMTKVGIDPMKVTHYNVRTLTRLTAPSLHESVQAIDTEYDGVSVRVYRPESNGLDRPAMIFVHGGGFHYGTPYGYESLSEMMVRNLDMVVVSVDYRSSLEHPSPAALDDCRTVAYYVYRNAQNLGIHPNKIGVAGDSAGGALAAALSLWLRDNNEHPRLAYQVLFYPWLQAFDFQLPSHWLHRDENSNVANVNALAIATLIYLNTTHDHHSLLVTNNHVSAAALQKYQTLINHELIPKNLVPKDYKFQQREGSQFPIDQEFERSLLDPYNFPLMATNLTNLPPTYVLVEEHDTLRDDGILFADRLKKVGNDVHLHHDLRGWHAMMCFLHGPLKVTVAEQIVYETIDFIKNRI